MHEILKYKWLSNTVADYLLATVFILVGWLLSRMVSLLISKLLFRLVRSDAENVPISDFVRLLRRPLQIIFELGIIYLATDHLQVPRHWVSAERFGLRMLGERIYLSALIGSWAWAIARFVQFFALIMAQKAQKTPTKVDDQLVPFLRDLGVITVWCFAILIELSAVFRIDVVAVIASLGIGGLALALAAKDTLENLFASFTIFLDSPFTVGDTIKVGDVSGDVEKIGFRSTRLRHADGSLITIPNRLLTTQTLENQTERQYRRSKYALHLSYATHKDTIEKISADITTLLANHPKTANKEGLVTLSDFNDSWLSLQVICYIETPDWRVYELVKQEINLTILDIVAQHGITFAIPQIEVFKKS
jgi:MscS family membrane protein